MGETFYRRMFFVGAAWNVVGGVLIVLITRWIFERQALVVPQPPLYYYAWIALFVTFGIGYYMVWKDMYSNKNIVILGIIGKLAFSAVFIWNFLAYRGQVPTFFLIPVIGDLVFVVLYWMFLNFARGRKT